MTEIDSTAGTPAQQMGQHLRQIRENAGLSVDAVALKLRKPKNLIHSLEAGNWQLDAPIFVRGHVRSYASLLGVELTGLDRIIGDKPAPVTPMVSVGRGQQLVAWLGARTVYVVITVLLGVPVWIAAQRHLSAPDTPPQAVTLVLPEVQPSSLPTPLPEQDLPQAFGVSIANTPASPTETAPAPPLTAMASLLPPATLPEPASPASDIVLSVNQDSWVELYAPGGGSLEQKLINAGEVRRFAHGQLGRVVIGNVDGVTLRIGGEVRDLSGVRRANVARFAVSSDGSIRPVSD